MFIQNEELEFIEILEEIFFKTYSKQGLVLAFDFDGVFTSPHKTKAEAINKLGYNISPEQTNSRYCVNIAGVKREDYVKGSMEAYIDRLLETPLEEGILGFIKWIKTFENIRIYLVTSRYDRMIPALNNYLIKHNLLFDGIFNTQNKSKKKILEKLAADFFIEDSPEKLLQVIKENQSQDIKNCEFILFRNSSNKFFQEPPSEITAINSFSELKIMVEKRLQN